MSNAAGRRESETSIIPEASSPLNLGDQPKGRNRFLQKAANYIGKYGKPIALAASLTAAVLGGSQFPSPHEASAQQYTRFGENENALNKMYPGSPVGETKYLYSFLHWGRIKDDTPDNTVRVSFESSFPDRPHLLIGEKGGKIIFKRVINYKTYFQQNIQILKKDQFRRYNPEAVLEPPAYYQPSSDYQLDVFTNSAVDKNVPHGIPGFAYVYKKDSGEMMESYTFPVNTPLDEFKTKFAQGDYNTAPAVEPSKPPVPEPAPQNPKPSILIFVNGLGSSLDADGNDPSDLAGPLRQTLSPSVTTINFSYNGGQVIKSSDGNLVWQPNSYKPEDTWNRSLPEHATTLGDTVEKVRIMGKSIIIGGYSLGGKVALEYAKQEILPETGRHRDGPVVRIWSAHSPLNGVPKHQLETTWGRVYLFGDTMVANQVTESLSAEARSQEAQQFTSAVNIQAVTFLKTRRKVEFISYGSRDDCLITTSSSIINGAGVLLNSGRGANGVTSCDAMYFAAISPTLAADIGHNQLLTSNEGVGEIARFSVSGNKPSA